MAKNKRWSPAERNELARAVEQSEREAGTTRGPQEQRPKVSRQVREPSTLEALNELPNVGKTLADIAAIACDSVREIRATLERERVQPSDRELERLITLGKLLTQIQPAVEQVVKQAAGNVSELSPAELENWIVAEAQKIAANREERH